MDEMIVNKQLADSNGVLEKDKWGTPKDLFDFLNSQYEFTLDPCCEVETAKCDLFFTPEEDGLKQVWTECTSFVNPPYSRGNIDQWMCKIYREAILGAKIVALVPVSTSSHWWHKYALKGSIVYLRGRLTFDGAKSYAPFSSALVFYNIQPESNSIETKPLKWNT